MIKLSICIPTYNRASHLRNCLNSILLSNLQSDFNFEICISDNNSSDDTAVVVQAAKINLKIKYHKNHSNLGIARNFLNVVAMAEGEFIWLIGDDDLLMPNAIHDLYRLIDEHPRVDFFYVNAYHLTTDYLDSYPAPFDTGNLPAKMQPFSGRKSSGELKFLDLIDPKISFDFLGGMFLSVFRKSLWNSSVDVLDRDAIFDHRTFSHFDNTFPHVKIFANAFSASRAFFNEIPLIVCLTGAREWSPMYPFIHSIRLVESLDVYRQNGLPFWRFVYCKNFALNNFMSDFANIFLARDISGYHFINPIRIIADYCCYPNFYLSFVYFFFRRARRILQSMR